MANNTTGQPSAMVKTKGATDTAKETIRREAESAKEELAKASDRIKQEASNVADQVKGRVGETAHEGKEAVAGGLTDFAAAVRKASSELGARDQSLAASVVREIAGGLEDAASAIHGRTVEDMTRSVASFARQQPATFLIGATLAGVALGRFVRGSEERTDPQETTISPANRAESDL